MRNDNKLLLFLNKVPFKGIVVSGGNDINQFLCRDYTEVISKNYAQPEKLLLLTTCRGLSVMSRWAGIGVYPVSGHVKTKRKIIDHSIENRSTTTTIRFMIFLKDLVL